MLPWELSFGCLYSFVCRASTEDRSLRASALTEPCSSLNYLEQNSARGVFFWFWLASSRLWTKYQRTRWSNLCEVTSAEEDMCRIPSPPLADEQVATFLVYSSCQSKSLLGSRQQQLQTTARRGALDLIQGSGWNGMRARHIHATKAQKAHYSRVPQDL